MACNPEVLKDVPLFALLDADEKAVLAAQVEVKRFAARERIYKMGDPGGKAYVVISGRARLTTVDADHQEVIVDEPQDGEFFGFASMLDRTPHQTDATAVEEAVCVEVERRDIEVLIERKPHAGMDILTVLGRQFHASQQLVRTRTARNANDVIEEHETRGERIADAVARFGGSWSFIIAVAIVLSIYTFVNVRLGGAAWDPYPFILLNLFSLHDCGHPGACDHDEPKPAGQEGPPAQRAGLRCQSPRGERDSSRVAQAQSAGRETRRRGGSAARKAIARGADGRPTLSASELIIHRLDVFGP